MTRWWSSPEQGVAVLRAVDDSDVVQGVGTALLGYHALTQGVLKPLSTQTLVDVSKVSSALDSVDLEPVAKALGAATKPVLGDAAEKYGEMLAEEIHTAAKDATERLLVQWTSTGMAWPNAVERAAEVHGVPLKRLGRYATIMKGPVTPLVRQDFADRALMEYASELGYRESEGVEDIAKANRDRDFDPNEHPRGAGGRFRRKGDNPDLRERQERRERRQKRNDRMRRAEDFTRERQSKVEQSREAARQQVNALMSMFLSSKKQEDTQAERKPAERVSARISARQPSARFKPEEASETPVAPPTASETRRRTQPAQEYQHRQRGASFFVLSRSEAAAAARNGVFEPGMTGLLAYTQEDLDRVLEEFSDPTEVMVFRAHDVPTTGERDDSRGGTMVPRQLKYNLRMGTQWFYEVDRSLPYREWVESFEVMDLEELDDENFGKNLSGAELQEFNNKRRRDRLGRFADKPDAPDLAERQARRERRARRFNRARDQRAAQAETKQTKTSVADQVRALMELNAEFNREPEARNRGRVQAKRSSGRVSGRVAAERADGFVADQTREEFVRDVIDANRVREARVQDFLNQEVVMMSDEDFAILMDAYVSDFSYKTNVAAMATDALGIASSFKKTKMVQAIDDLQRPSRGTADKNFYTTEQDAYHAGLEKMEELSLRSDKNIQFEVVRNPDGTYQPRYHNYDNYQRNVILTFESESARKEFYNGGFVAFEMITDNDLGEVIRDFDVDPYHLEPDQYELNPPVTAFRIRERTAEESHGLTPRMTPDYY